MVNQVIQVRCQAIFVLLIQCTGMLSIGLPGAPGYPGIPGPKGEAVRVDVRKTVQLVAKTIYSLF